MAREIFIGLLAYVVVVSIMISSSTTLASSDDTAAASFIHKTCEDATYIDVCLSSLLPSSERINGSNEKAVQLAIMATISQVQSTNTNIARMSRNPKLWSRELSALNSCRSAITKSALGLESAVEATNHLGGGSKSDKEAKRLSIEDYIQSVQSASNTCVDTLHGSRARDVLVRRVEQTMEPLVELATNAVDLVHHMQF